MINFERLYECSRSLVTVTNASLKVEQDEIVNVGEVDESAALNQEGSEEEQEEEDEEEEVEGSES